MFNISFLQGMYSEITGPTLPYMKQRVSCNYEQIGRALAARSVGFLIGSLTGGVLCDKYSIADLFHNQIIYNLVTILNNQEKVNLFQILRFVFSMPLLVDGPRRLTCGTVYF